MTSEELFAMGLGLHVPWIVTSSKIENGELHIEVDFEVGASFLGRKVHDTVKRSWRHLNFWQYPTYIHARTPRVIQDDGKVVQVEVPWARPGSGFTALFEALALAMAKSMPVSEVARNLQVDDMGLWRLMILAVECAREKADYRDVCRIGLDETAARRGHNYITTFVDLDKKRVLFGCLGKGIETIEQFKEDFKLHGGNPKRVTTFSCDMSPAFLSGIAEHFPNAEVVLDKFHLVKMLGDAVDAVRREEVGKYSQAKGTRYLFLKNPGNLTQEQFNRLNEMLANEAYAQTAEAYRLRLAFQDLFREPKASAPGYLKAWIDAALRSGIEAIIHVARTFHKVKDKILAWFDHRVTNGILEGLNSVLQSAKARARGYANPRHMILMSYLIHGKLELSQQALLRTRRTKTLSTISTHSM
jgi:transposase